jgi:hypothetical protein
MIGRIVEFVIVYAACVVLVGLLVWLIVGIM